VIDQLYEEKKSKDAKITALQMELDSYKHGDHNRREEEGGDYGNRNNSRRSNSSNRSSRGNSMSRSGSRDDLPPRPNSSSSSSASASARARTARAYHDREMQGRSSNQRSVHDDDYNDEYRALGIYSDDDDAGDDRDHIPRNRRGSGHVRSSSASPYRSNRTIGTRPRPATTSTSTLGVRVSHDSYLSTDSTASHTRSAPGSVTGSANGSPHGGRSRRRSRSASPSPSLSLYHNTREFCISPQLQADQERFIQRQLIYKMKEDMLKKEQEEHEDNMAQRFLRVSIKNTRTEIRTNS
jgi:hypothetical protein